MNVNKKETFPLSLSQMNIWNLELSMQGTSVNNISATIRIQGRIDFPLLQKCIQDILRNDPSLRTRIILGDDGIPVQYHEHYIEEEIPVYDLSSTGEDGVRLWEEAMTRQTIPLTGQLYSFSIFRTGENSGGVLVKTHHIISDGWSQVLLCNRITRSYLRLLSGEEVEPMDIPSYRIHVEEEEKYLKSKAYIRDEAYWRKVLEEAGEPSMLKSIKSAAISPIGKRYSVDLPQLLNHEIYDFCKKNRVAPFAVYYMALAIYFKRIGGADRFTIAVPILNRTTYQLKQCTGMFVTTLPFFNRIDDNWTWNQFNENLMEQWLELLRHQRYPYTHIEKLSQELTGKEDRLFHIALSYQDSQAAESRDASVAVSGRWHYSGYQAEQLCIHLTNLYDNKKYSVDYDYLTQYFSEEEIRKLHDIVCIIMHEGLSNPDKPINSLSILSMDEKEKVLYSFNRTDRHIRFPSAFSMVEAAAKANPEKVAIIYNQKKTTYREMMHHAAAISQSLPAHEEENEKLIAVMLPRSKATAISMVSILYSGNAFLMLSADIPAGRLQKIATQGKISALITSRSLWEEKAIAADGFQVLFYEELPEYGEMESIHITDPNRLAYVVYTSGSTGEPKGVEIMQKSLVNLAQAMDRIYGSGGILSFCNVSFDAHLLESILPLMSGRTLIIADDEEAESPKALAKLVTGFAAGFCPLSPSRLGALLREPDFRAAAGRMEGLLCGGENFSPNLLKELKNVTRARLYNQYGPSETTVAVSLKELSGAEHLTIGAPMDNCRLYVLDKWLNPLPTGVYGGLYVGGICVGRGYRNMPELTAEFFLDSPFESGEKIYYTGDLACWTEEGEILLAGRMDNQVKIRGLRIEPEEIAACIASYDHITGAAAKIWEVSGEPVIAGYYSSEVAIRESDLLIFIASYLPHYMIPAILVKMDKIPVAASGKIDLAKLPMPDFDKQTIDAGQAGALTMDILAIFKKVLERDLLEPDSDYFVNGGNSLNAMETIGEIEDLTGKRLRVAQLYACRTARRLAEYLGEEQAALQPQKAPLIKAPKRPWYELSPIQQGIYVQSYLDPKGTAYNMPGAFKISKKIDIQRLEQAFCKLISEDDIFRAEFVQDPDGIHMHLREQVTFSFESLSGNSLQDVMRDFIRPFDLSRGPLIRAAVFEEACGERYLLIDSHHIIGDGLSTPVVLSRLAALYEGLDAKPRFTYFDYLYQREQEKNDEGNLAYWKGQFDSVPEPLVLPVDFPRPHQFDFKGAEYDFTLPEDLAEACTKYCKEEGISDYILFLGAFSILIANLTGRRDFTVGIPTAGRKGSELMDICGPFINTLPLPMNLADRKIRNFLEDLASQVNQALDHQDTPLESIISKLGLGRSEQNRLYQIMFSQSPVDTEDFTLGGEVMEFVQMGADTVKMDMTWQTAKNGGRYEFNINYARSLFLPETIAYYGRCYKQILKNMIQNPESNLQKVKVLDPEDYATYVEQPNYLATPFVNLPIHRMIKQKAEAGPGEIAMVFHGAAVSRAELERRACGIAHRLVDAGVLPGNRIGIAEMRGPDLIASMLAVLKAGCAYVPMLANYPAARIHYMVETADVNVILCDEVTKGMLSSQLPCKMISIEGAEAEEFQDVAVSDMDLVNVMFTSGSTGRPKGVMLKHRSVSSLYVSIRELLSRSEGPILCTTNVVFDSFIGESLFPLAMGKKIVIADEEEMMLPWKLAQLIEVEGARIFQVTPARLQMCLGNEAFCKAAAKLELVMLGGEVLTDQLLSRLDAVTGASKVNMYGPTEATVYMTMIDVKKGDHITIGRPLANGRIYILDEEGNPVMPTACGELYMAGECLAKGYISRPDLTEEAFVADLYFPEQKMYRSGDLGRLRLDGSIDFLGRRDSQVKLNGQRVELDEITSAIMESGAAKQAATIALQKGAGAMELWSFFEPKEGEEESRKTIERFVKKTLPGYMIPSRLVALGKIPLTPSSKIDLRQLQKMAMEGELKTPEVMQAVSNEPEEITANDVMEKLKKLEEKIASENTTREACKEIPTGKETFNGNIDTGVEKVLNIWRKVLTKKELSPDLSFFEQGGTSLDALTVLSAYFNDQKELSLSAFYEHPTARMQAELLGYCSDSSQNAEVLQRQADGGAILVTGGTGFFGAHLIKVLLEKTEKQIICLIRKDRERLLEILNWYFSDGFTEQYAQRIETVTGDITCAHFGLDEAIYTAMLSRIDCLYHCAADVRHYAADEKNFLAVNVEGTQNALEIAREGHAAFYQMSTCSVSGTHLKEGGSITQFTESDFDIGQIWEDNIYVKSKFLAEAQVQKAMEQGMNCKIFRLGRLVGRTTDGRFQINPDTNAFYMLMKAFHFVGCVPETIAEATIDLTPVDYAAEAIFALSNREEKVFHITSPVPPTVREAVKSASPDLEFVSDEEFTRRLMEKVNGPHRTEVAVAVDYWYQIRFKKTEINVSSAATCDILKEMGFKFEIPSPGHLLQSFSW